MLALLGLTLAAGLFVVVQAAPARAASASTPLAGLPWKPGSTLKLYSRLPKHYDRSTAEAIRQINTAGARIRMRRVHKQAGANIVMRFGPTTGAGGLATLGRMPSGPSTIFIASWWDKFYGKQGPYVAAFLITHEIGHVLGLNHPRKSSKLCTVMLGRFETLCRQPDLVEGTWVCSILQPSDHRALVKRYGGRAKPARRWLCPLPKPKPLKQSVTGVTVEPATDPASKGARVRWSPVRTAGLRMHVERRDVACARSAGQPITTQVLGADANNLVAAATGAAIDPGWVSRPTVVCYSLTLVDPKTKRRSATVKTEVTLLPPTDSSPDEQRPDPEPIPDPEPSPLEDEEPFSSED